MLPTPKTPEQRRRILIDQLLRLINGLFEQSSSITFLKTQQELITSFVLLENENTMNDRGMFPMEIANILHRAKIQSVFLLELEEIFNQLEK